MMILQKDGGQVGKTISHYKILEKLGEGGMGVVYKAEDTKLKRTVALKFLPHHLLANEEDKTRFLHEAQAASALNHPNIMTIHQIDEMEGETFIAMELVEGETLKKKVRSGQFAVRSVIDIAIQVADGVVKAHKKGIIHRDIKSENIMVSTDGLVKIMDFGIAKRGGDTGTADTGLTPGTLAYMSPEQTEGSEVDHRSDLFSLGVVLYEMATGRLPFPGEHEAAIIYCIVNETPVAVQTLNPEIPAELERIINKLLEKDPEDRYQHAEDLLADLKKLKKDLDSGRVPVGKARPAALEKPEKKVPVLWWNYVLAVVIVVAMAAFAFQMILKRQGPAASAAAENSLAVLGFENLKTPDDPERLGQIIQELIIADLSEIPTLKVFSSQRLFDIQKQLGSKDRTKIDRELATEIAKQAGAETMLTGNLIQTDKNMILTSQLVEVQRGTVIESQRVEGNDVYALVDDLAAEIHGDLSLPRSEEGQLDVAVKEKTTSSVGAYQHYLAGVDLLNDSRFDSAVARFQKVVSIDPTFTQAFYKMAIAQWWSQSSAGEATSEQARESLSHCLSGESYISTKDKFMAEGALAMIDQRWDDAQDIYQQLVSFVSDEKEAWYGLGEAYFHGVQDLVKALGAFEKVIKLDPEFSLAYRHIFDIYAAHELFDHGLTRAIQLVALNPDEAWGHFHLGHMFRGKEENFKALDAFERAVELDPQFISAYDNIFDIYIEEDMINQAIRRAKQLITRHPDQWWAYSYLGGMYRENGEFDLAVETYKNGLSNAPESQIIFENLGYVYRLVGRYDKAVQTYMRLTEPGRPIQWQLTGNFLLADVHGEQGQYTRALNLLREANLIAKSVGIDYEAESLINMAFCAFFIGDSTTALAKLSSARGLQPSMNSLLSSYWAEGVMRRTWGQEQGVSVVLDTVRQMVRRQGVSIQAKVIENALTIEMYIIQREVDKALAEFGALDDNEELRDIYLYHEALLLLAKGDYEEALNTTLKMQSHTISQGAYSYTYPRGFYVRGLIYEKMGDLALARENYEKLLSLWQYGDEEIQERKDASERLGRLIRQLG